MLKKKSTKFIDDVHSISYILEDDGYKIFYIGNPDFQIVPNKDSKILSIMLSGGSKKFINDQYGWSQHLLHSECYSEYLYRLQDICYKLDFKIGIMGTDSGSFFVDSISIFNKNSNEIQKVWQTNKHFKSKKNRSRYFEPDEIFNNLIDQSVVNESKSTIDDIIEEIKQLSYIVEDDSLECDIHETPLSMAFKEHNIGHSKERYYIRINPPRTGKYESMASEINKKRWLKWANDEKDWKKANKGRTGWTESNYEKSDYPRHPTEVDWRDVFVKDLIKNKSFLEYRDRVYEICIKNNLRCSRQGNGILIEVK